MPQPMTGRTRGSLGRNKSRLFAHRRAEERGAADPPGTVRAGTERGGDPGGRPPRSGTGGEGCWVTEAEGRDPRRTLGLAEEWGAPETASPVTTEGSFPPAVYKNFRKTELRFKSKNNVFLT